MNIRNPDTSPYLCFRNGKRAVSGLLPEGAHLGVGVFETVRARRTASGRAALLALSRHLDRLEAGSNSIGSGACDRQVIHTTLESAFRAFEWGESPDALLRLVVYRQEWFLTVEPWRATIDSVAGASASIEKAARSHPELKSCSALVSVLAREKARASGCAEAILVDGAGAVREGAWSNVFTVDRSGKLSTPALGVLPGITRSIVLELASAEGIRTEEREIGLDEISASAEIFMTQATHGIFPVVKVAGSEIGDGRPGRLTSRLRSAYERLFESGASPLVSLFDTAV